MNNLTLVGLCLASGTAYASNLNPGGTVSQIPVYSYGLSQLPSGNLNNGAVGANTSLPGAAWSAGSNLAGANINFADAAYVDPTSGDLDFFYQIEPSILGNPIDSSSAELSTVIDGCSPTGLTITGVNQITSASFNQFGNFARPTSSTNSISSVSLSSNDQDLTIDFSANVAPGEYSAILMIETNAASCDTNAESAISISGTGGPPGDSSGSQSIQTGSSGTPVVAPEPGVYGILCLESTGLLLLIHRRHREGKRKSNAACL